MKVSEAWLREWVNPKENVDQLVHLLTMAGLEVDAVEAATASFSGVVVGEIVQVEAHPDAEKLRVCQVSNGDTQVQVVCGAPNAAVGLKVPFAEVGAQLPGDMKIGKAKLRGIESMGMLCGASELGLDDIVDGLLVLPEDAPPGKDFRSYLSLDDNIIDIDLTPNRGDCLSLCGVAREVGVLTQTDVNSVDASAITASISDQLSITLTASEHCPRYAGRVIKGVDASAETPLWMREKLRRAGLRSIDAIVDVTNYVLLELGQPLHAFDLDKLKIGGASDIEVRLASANESLKLLDDSEVQLDDDMLVIANGDDAIALAGIMGGDSTAVSSDTKNIFLESASFTPELLAGKARRLGMHTDASHRFERGVDNALQERAAERATQLLLEIVGGQAGPTTVVDESGQQGASQLVLRESQIKRVLGFAIPSQRVDDILQRLELSPESVDGGWRVTVPSHRFDIAIEADLLEELARIYGYDNLPVEPPAAQMQFSETPEGKVPVARMREQLVARGYQEAITYSFIDPELQSLFANGQQSVELANPIASDMSHMRSSLLPGLVTAATYNLNRQQQRLRLFETGLRFRLASGADSGQALVAGGVEQQPMIAGLLTGARAAECWANDNKQMVDFYDLKADIEALIRLGGAAQRLEFRPSEHSALHPGQAAQLSINGQYAGDFGLLHPELSQKLGLSAEIWLFELQLNLISEKKVPEFKELSRFPEVRRDLAIIVDSGIPAMEVVTCAEQAAGDNVVAVTLFDQYSGAGIEEGKQSIGLGITWQHLQRTLNEDEVNALTQDVITSLEQRYSASLR